MGLYSHYDGAHNHPVNRILHMVAISVGFSSVIVVWWHGSLRRGSSRRPLRWLGRAT